MSKKKKYLSLYKKWMKSGQITDYFGCEKNGLCGVFDCLYGTDETFLLLKPTDEDILKLKSDGLSSSYWGNGTYTYDPKYWNGGFSPLRQNIVLFMAAINNEL